MCALFYDRITFVPFFSVLRIFVFFLFSFSPFPCAVASLQQHNHKIATHLRVKWFLYIYVLHIFTAPHKVVFSVECNRLTGFYPYTIAYYLWCPLLLNDIGVFGWLVECHHVKSRRHTESVCLQANPNIKTKVQRRNVL